MDAVKVAALPTDLHQEAIAGYRLPDEAPRYAKDACLFETLQPVRDALLAQTRGSHEHHVGGAAHAIMASMKAQQEGFQDGEPDIAQDAIPGACGLRAPL
jgi:hypothetical protein